MKIGFKAAVITALVTFALYFVIFLVTVPTMASSSQVAQTIGGSIYVAIYRPIRDLLPSGYGVLELWRDYEHYWCAQSTGCEL